MEETEDVLQKIMDDDSTKNQIIGAAVELLPEKGYERTSMKEIAQHADVTKPAVYYYFDNKEELFKEIVEIGQKQSLYNVKKVVESEKEMKEKLFDIVMSSFDFHTNNPAMEKFMRWIMTEGFKYIAEIMGERSQELYRQLKEIFNNLIDEEIEKGNVKKDIDADILLGIISGTINYFAREYLFLARGKLNKKQAEQIVDIILQGIEP